MCTRALSMNQQLADGRLFPSETTRFPLTIVLTIVILQNILKNEINK